MLLWLLLGACAVVDCSFDYYEETYGKTHRISLPRKAESLEFLPEHETGRIVLWKRDDPQTIEDSRRKVIGSYYVIRDVTQKDNGRYLIKEKDWSIMVWHNLEVKAETLDYSLSPGETFTVSSVLRGTDCNIYFFPENGGNKQVIVYQGTQEYLSFCTELRHETPCGLYCGGVERTCNGQFEFRDRDDNTALVINLEVEPLEEEEEKPYLAATIGGVALIIFGTCVKMCCVRKSSSAKTNTDTPQEEDEPAASTVPAAFYYENRHERFRPQTAPYLEPPETPPAPPSAPLIHSPPTNVPPSYFQNHNERIGGSTEPLSQPSAQSSLSLMPPTFEPPSYAEVMSQEGSLMFPLASGPDQRFEVSGATFASAPPLSSEAAEPNVYTSEKLNFL